jgi:hypothetical protein
MKQIIEAVDVEVFEKAFNIWYDAIAAAPPNERDPAAIGALFRAFSDNHDLYEAIGVRIVALDDLIHTHQKRILKWKGFPEAWIGTAATAPLKCLERFDPKLFRWPKGKERVA